MKKIISLLSVLILVLGIVSVGGIGTSAAGKSSISFSKRQLNVGDSVTVSVKVSADETMYGLEFVINYDPAILKFVSGDNCSGGAGVVSVASAASSKTATISCSFKALKAGSCYISTADIRCVNLDEKLISIPAQGANITVKDVSLSSNANLKALSISDGKLSPSFSSSTTSYTATVDRETTSCKIYATASDKDAKVSVEGGNNLQIGTNNCSVTVTAPNGSQKVYKIKITRSSTSTDTSSDEPEDENSEQEPDEVKPDEILKTEIGGLTYSVAKTLKDATLPSGFSERAVDYKGVEINIAVDDNDEFFLYYLGAEGEKKLEPYTYDSEYDRFERVQYLKQGENFYIFTDIPAELTLPDGYYITNTKISDFNVSCYSSNEPDLSSFYYVYCFNGEESCLYRYDSYENVLQRSPEIKLINVNDTDDVKREDNFIARFSALQTNAKIVVIGAVLLIIGVLSLIILFIIKLLSNRGEAEFISNMDYTEDFDNIDYSSSFSLESDYVTADNEQDDIIDDIQSENEIESDYITEENIEEE